jgi:tight adherence protein B
MLESLAAAATFVTVSSGTAYLFLRGRASLTVEQRLGGLRPGRGGAVTARGLLRRTSSGIPGLRGISSGNYAGRTELVLQRAGLNLRVSEYLLLRALLAVVLGTLIMLLFGGSFFGVVFGLVGGWLGYMLPAFYVNFLTNRRINRLNSQLVEGLTLISNSLRSGFAFTQAVELASKQLEPPLQEELERFVQDNALGARTEDALHALAERTGSYDVDMMVTSIVVQRSTGGNLSEILDNVAETVRERERLQGEIRAMTAQQRLTGLILSIYPIVLAAIFTLVAPSLMKVLVTEEAGRILLVSAVILQLCGIWMIQRALRLEV